MAVGAENDQIANVVVVTIIINVSNFQNFGDAESTMGASGGVFLERDFSIVKALGSCDHV